MDREQKLTHIVQRLEAKLRAVQLDNQELKQRLELAELEQQLAAENADKLATRNAELEELQQLSAELEESYAADKARLEAEAATLRETRSEAQASSQQFAALRLELAVSEQRLSAAQLELAIVRGGFGAALAPVLAPVGAAPWLPLLDVLGVAAQPLVDAFGRGDVSAAQLAQQLKQRVDEALDAAWTADDARPIAERLARSAETRSAETRTEDGDAPEFERLQRKLAYLLRPASPEPAAAAEPSAGDELRLLERELADLRLRNEILEHKLARVQAVAADLDALRQWQAAAVAREAQLTATAGRLDAQLGLKQRELDALRKQSLPGRLQESAHRAKVQRLLTVVEFLTAEQPRGQLDALERRPLRFSRLVGNARVAKLREFAAGLRLGATPAEAQRLAIEQDSAWLLI